MLIDRYRRACLSGFGRADFDCAHWPGATSDSDDQGETTAYTAPELFHREREEGQSNVPLMRKEADVYALGMLIYEVRPMIENFCGRTLNAFIGPVWKTAVPQCALGQPHGFERGATTTTFIDTDPGSHLGNTASMLERRADSEADSGARHDHVHGLRIAERASSGVSKEFI